MNGVDYFLDLQRDGRSRDEILTTMNERGLTIAQAIKYSMQMFGLGLGDANSVVASHASWSKTVEAARPFQEALIQAFRDAENTER